jgi:DNA-binding transcriptional MocR family regulator
MPTYQNPTGRSLCFEKRRALLRIAAAFDLPIVEDDSAGFFNLEAGPAPPSLKTDDQAGYVIHLGTFSKLIAAGLRLGWLVADPPVFEKLVAAKYASDLSSDALVQRAVHRLLASGALEAHLLRAREAYRVRRDALVAALRRPNMLPAAAHFDAPEGGFNLWLELPREGPSSTELFLEAVRRGVAFVPGPFFFSAGGGGPSSSAALRGLRLSYSALAPADLERGVELLSEAIRSITVSGRSTEAVVY